MGLQTMENLMSSTVFNSVGDPVFIGILLLGFFVGFVFLQRTSGDARLLVLIGASFLVAAFIPVIRFFLVIVLTVLFGLALLKLLNR